MPKLIKDHDLFGYTETEWKQFSKTKRWRIRNPEKMKQATRSWYERNTEHVKTNARKYKLRDSYNITPVEYDQLLKAQNLQCAICQTDKPTGRWKVFAVDHCHTTGKVRGLLCNECNRGMGLLKDSPDLLQKALNYLKGKS